MTAHDRKALLRAFYGLATLWIINGVFGLLRASGPGALLPYIELGVLIAYWVWVINWWSKNKPRSQTAQAKRTSLKSKRTWTSDEIAAAVDREEAISRERNRRRKKRLQSSVSAAGEKISTAAYQLRFLFAGIAVLFVIVGGFLAYQEIKATFERQEVARETEIREQESKTRVFGAFGVWNNRNNCVADELELRWRAWYELNPETRTEKYFSLEKLKWITVTKTLALPESLDDVGMSLLTVADQRPKYWRVSQQHFAPLISLIQDACMKLWPPPDGMAETWLYPGSMDFYMAGVSSEDHWKYDWTNPFPNKGLGW